ncbi:MAG: Secretion system C-terminal sorting domain [Bacteroidota bacterium]|jgi:hypothetical protein
MNKLKSSIALMFIAFINPLVAQNIVQYPVEQIPNNPYVAAQCNVSRINTGYLLNYSYTPASLETIVDLTTILIKTDNNLVPQWRKNLGAGKSSQFLLGSGDYISVLSNKQGVRFRKFNNADSNVLSKQIQFGNSAQFTKSSLSKGIVYSFGDLHSYWNGQFQNGLGDYTTSAILTTDTNGNFIGLDSIVFPFAYASTILTGIPSSTSSSVYFSGIHRITNTLRENFIAKKSGASIAWTKVFLLYNRQAQHSASLHLPNNSLLFALSINDTSIINYSTFFINLDTNGNVNWCKKTDSSFFITDLEIDNNNDVVATGFHQVAGSPVYRQNAIIKLSQSGNFISSSIFDTTVNNSNTLNEIGNTYLMANFFKGTPTIYRLDSNLLTTCIPVLSNTLTLSTQNLNLTNGFCTLLPSNIYSNITTSNIIDTLQNDSTVCGTATTVTNIDFHNANTVYPNPFLGSFILKIKDGQDLTDLSFYNCYGQKVNCEIMKQDNELIYFDCSNWASGFYYLKIDGSVIKLQKSN